MQDSILITRKNQLVTLTFNRPETMNAFNREMAERFEQLCAEISSDDSVRVVLLQSVGESFMAGSDIYELNNDFETLPAEALSLVRQFNACVLMLREMEKLVVASVHGIVLGTGMSLVLVADLVIASHNAKFSLSCNRLALSPAGAISYLLPRAVGLKRAMGLLLMPEMLDATTALSFGLINWVVPHAELSAQTEQIVDYLLSGPFVALHQTKQLVNSAYHNKLMAQLEFEAEALVKCVNTKDFKDALHALVNKRVPELEKK